MFTKTIIKEVKVIDEKRVLELEAEIKQIKKDFESDKRILEAEIKQIKKDFESDKRILEAELQTRINQAVLEKEKESYKIKEENSVLKKEVEILEKAFENMGFDVKDMKEILNKLVDGIVSGNKVNIIK